MLNEKGVSEVIGAILLVSLVILGAMIVAVLFLSQPPPQEIPQVNAIAGNDTVGGVEYIYLLHDGGDPLTPMETIIRIDGGRDPGTIEISTEDGSYKPWMSGEWSVGKTLRITDDQPPQSVSLVYSGGSSQALLLTSTFVGTLPTAPTGTATTAPTGTATTSPPCENIMASFSANLTSGDIPLTVSFTDTSTGDPTNWYWTFGDDDSSALQNPVHTYYTVGDYTVSLNASKDEPGCSRYDIETKTYYIHATCPEVSAAFTASPTTGEVPLTVQFTDQSTGNPTSWSWAFGDGDTSNEQNPEHEYTSVGPFTVILTASNDCGNSDTVRYINYISPSETWTGGVVNLTKMCGNAGYLKDGTYYQFQKGKVANIAINGNTYTNSGILKNKVVKLEINGDQSSGYIYMDHPNCYAFSFNVKMYVDDTLVDTGLVTAITADANKNNDISTLTYVLDPSCTAYTHLIINSEDVINQDNNNAKMIISNMKIIHDNKDPYVNKLIINLDGSHNQINTEGDIRVY